MFNPFVTKTEPTDLEKLIANVIADIDGLGMETEEATARVDNLKTLMEARDLEAKIKKPWRPDADVVVTAAGSLIGILSILTFEKANVLTSKSLSFVMKPKL